MTPQEEYAQHAPNWAEGLNALPERMHGGLVRYILHGIPPGHFLTAVLKGDLFAAFGRADEENRYLIWRYVQFLHNFAPIGCFRSPENFDGWVSSGGLIGLTKDREGQAV